MSGIVKNQNEVMADYRKIQEDCREVRTALHKMDPASDSGKYNILLEQLALLVSLERVVKHRLMFCYNVNATEFPE